MKELIEKLFNLGHLLEPYPSWTKILVSIWILFSAAVIIGLIFAKQQGHNDQSSPMMDSAAAGSVSQTRGLAAIVAAESVQDLRRLNGVRALRPLENDLSLRELPPGVYGFTVPWIINSDPTGIVGGTGINRITLEESSGGTSVMEIHKRGDDQVYVVGYVSETDLIRLQDPSRATNADVALFFAPFREFSIPVAIPVSRIQKSRNRSVADQYVDDLSVH
jgi:hypothetical protein